ncbi:hypothetical protein E6C60_3664 [Paenibacillus algicola]|uniref:Exodeoxyribonuclease X-like C-terminal domain-containing protein n=1 Tax=Paenibacillus algicola TaxID=2565926 RepID=A0A4P8XNE1_9BACL|nr:hypothetical protein [Paenibacillus algicola]QCT04372.1 hypothetical protein E6C60_3664 [Paenibacillus algicola]
MEMTMTFGKYKGMTIEEVFLLNSSYFSWMKETGMSNRLEYEEFIESIPYQYPERFKWVVDIRSGYQCWKCKKMMNIFLLFNPEVENELRHGYPIISDLAYSKPNSLIFLANEYGIQLEERYSKMTESKYVMHICPHCKMHQGDNYVVEDNEQETVLIKSIQIVFENGAWKEGCQTP